jgi:predicted nucleic acid-binding protein
MVAFDSTILSILLFPDATLNHAGQVVPDAKERVESLVKDLESRKERILIPAPALCEVLVTKGVEVNTVLEKLRTHSLIRIGDFDQRAAIELALQLREAINSRDAREGCNVTKSKMKFDRQIVAISIVNGAKVLYSDDRQVKVFAETCGLQVVRVIDIDSPHTQTPLPF